jgi:hypothetical protein
VTPTQEEESKPKNTDLLFYVSMAALIIACLYMISTNMFSDNIVAAVISGISIAVATGSLILTRSALEETKKSVNLTEKTLMKTENEQKRRDIEKSFDYFYYPLRDFLEEWMAPANNPDLHIENIINFAMDPISHYRYLATDRTREYFEMIYRQHSYIKYEEATLLLKYVTEDIKIKTKGLKDIKNP